MHALLSYIKQVGDVSAGYFMVGMSSFLTNSGLSSGVAMTRPMKRRRSFRACMLKN